MATRRYVLDHTSSDTRPQFPLTLHRISKIRLFSVLLKLKFVCLACTTVREQLLNLMNSQPFDYTLKCKNPKCETAFRIWNESHGGISWHVINLSGDFIVPVYYPPPFHVVWRADIIIEKTGEVKKLLFAADECGNWKMGRKMFEKLFGTDVSFDPPSVSGLSVHLHEQLEPSSSSGSESDS